MRDLGMPESTEPEGSRAGTEAKRRRRSVGPLGVLGRILFYGIVGILFVPTVLFGIVFGQFIWLAVSVGAVGLVWLLSMRIRRLWPRLWLRAIALSLAFTPFIQHASVEWSTPWPPAAFWVLISLSAGDVALFELLSIVATTVVIWLASLAVYYDRHGDERRPTPLQPTSGVAASR